MCAYPFLIDMRAHIFPSSFALSINNIFIHCLCRRDASFSLTYDDLDCLNDAIKADWESFVLNAPASWKADGWIQTHHPVGIAAKYGQNIRITPPDPAKVESWSASHDFESARYFTVAVATHVEYGLNSLSLLIFFTFLLQVSSSLQMGTNQS